MQPFTIDRVALRFAQIIDVVQERIDAGLVSAGEVVVAEFDQQRKVGLGWSCGVRNGNEGVRPVVRFFIQRWVQNSEQQVPHQDRLAGAGLSGEHDQAGLFSADNVEYRTNRLFGITGPLKLQPLRHVLASVLVQFVQQCDQFSIFRSVTALTGKLFEFFLGDLDRRRVLTHMLRLKNVRDDQYTRIFGVSWSDVCQLDRRVPLLHEVAVLLLLDGNLYADQLLAQLTDGIQILRHQHLTKLRCDECAVAGSRAEIGGDHVPGIWNIREFEAARVQPLTFQQSRIGQFVVAEIANRFQQMFCDDSVIQKLFDRIAVPRPFLAGLNDGVQHIP